MGFVLELCGTHERPEEHSTWDCVRCRRIYAVLRLVADWVLPCKNKACGCDIQICSPFISNSPTRGNQPGVSLTVKVFHRVGHDRLVFGCEPYCLSGTEARLRELKARQLRT